MTTTAIDNRNAAYLSIIEKLPQKKQLIFQLIKENAPCTAWQISDKYMIPINEVVARISDLKNDCLLVEAGSSTNRYTKKPNTLYSTVNSINERIDLVNKTFVSLRDARDKFVNDYNLGLSSLTKAIVKKKLIKINKQINLLSEIKGLDDAE
jgi:hypothetical protein